MHVKAEMLFGKLAKGSPPELTMAILEVHQYVLDARPGSFSDIRSLIDRSSSVRALLQPKG